MHFFNPVDRMELVEVIRGEKTSDETVATIVALAKRIRKTPIVVKDCAGFLVNRVLFPYMNESLVLLLEGASMEAIDRAATKFGMPMGPIALTDLVGLDTACFAGKVVAEAYPDRTVEHRDPGRDAQGERLGKKSGPDSEVRRHKRQAGRIRRSCRSWKSTGPAKREVRIRKITDRLFLPMLLEATRVLEEGIVREPADVDMGLILGVGFPPFRGGILRWCDRSGQGRSSTDLEVHAARQAI